MRVCVDVRVLCVLYVTISTALSILTEKGRDGDRAFFMVLASISSLGRKEAGMRIIIIAKKKEQQKGIHAYTHIANGFEGEEERGKVP